MINFDDQPWTAKNRLEPDFLAAFGRFVATVGDFESILLDVAWQIRSTEQKPESEWDLNEVESVLERFKRGLSDTLYPRLQLFKSSYEARYDDWSDSGLDDFMYQAEKIRDYRNCFCHCSWQKTDQPGIYRAKRISRQDNFLDTPVDAAMLNQISTAVEELLQVLNDVMGVKGIHPMQDLGHENKQIGPGPGKRTPPSRSPMARTRRCRLWCWLSRHGSRGGLR